MLAKTGYPTQEQVKSAFPGEARLGRGPVAIIECFQKIPCDPCRNACKIGAILPFADINDLPKIDVDLCNGCCACITLCPGLAIMVVDMSYSDRKCLVKLPYEFPLPKKGSVVTATDRAGEPVCRAVVKDTRTAKNKASIVTLEIDREHVYDVRSFTETDKTEPVLSSVLSSESPHTDDTAIICRCNDISAGQLMGYINKGLTSVDEIKRASRLGMGACQGRNCIPLVIMVLAAQLGVGPADIAPGSFRPVTRSVSLGALTDYAEEHNE